jgi:hypothetical protein
VVIAGKELPIGNLYKNVFMHRFGKESWIRFLLIIWLNYAFSCVRQACSE